MTSPRSGRVLSSLALAAAAVIGILVAGELLARFVLARPREIPSALPVLNPLRDLAGRNVDGILLGTRYRTNSEGLRGPEYTPEPPEGVARIIVGGDSVTMGWGVEEGQAYPRLLARRLGEGRVEVLNAGLAGLAIDGVVDRLAAAVASYRPDLIVYGFTINDIQGPSYRPLTPPAAALEQMARHRRFVDSPFYLLRLLWPRWVALGSSGSRAYAEELEHNYFENPEAWHAFTLQLDRLAELARRSGVCAHVLIHTSLERLDAEHPYYRVYRRVGAAARERGLTVTSSYASFAGRRPSTLRIGYLDGHPNARGHELLAEALGEGLRALPESCWPRGDTQPSGAGGTPRRGRVPGGGGEGGGRPSAS